MAIADRIAGGEDPESARLAAIKEFGNVLQAQEDARQVWRGGAVGDARSTCWQDVRFGVRMLVQEPGLLAGRDRRAARSASPATPPIFSLFKGLALKPMPGVQDSATLAVMLSRTSTARPMGLSLPDYRYIREHDRAFVDLAASLMIFASVGLGADAERVDRRARHRQLLPGARRRRATGPHHSAVRRCGAWSTSGRRDRRRRCGGAASAPIAT